MTKTAMEAVQKVNLPPLARMSLALDATTTTRVLAFHHVYGAPIKPFGNPDAQFRHMDDSRVATRLHFIVEELRELFEKGFGIQAQVLLTVPDHPGGSYRCDASNHLGIQSALGHASEAGHRRNGAEVADALGDLDYVQTGMMIEMGFDPRIVGAEIHAGNMTKLGADGQPIIADGSDPLYPVGKVLKGPYYREPNIPAVLGFDE